MGSYITIQGDTFDRIARKVYGDERRMDILVRANPEALHTLVFPAGISLHTPELAKTYGPPAGAPPWRKL